MLWRKTVKMEGYAGGMKVTETYWLLMILPVAYFEHYCNA